MKELDKNKIKRTLEVLRITDAEMPILKTAQASKIVDGWKVYDLDKEYLTICTALIFNIYNLGLIQAIYFAEQKLSEGSSKKPQEKKRYQLCQALLRYLVADKDFPTLGDYVTSLTAKEQIKAAHEISEALDYFKLLMQIGIKPKNNTYE